MAKIILRTKARERRHYRSRQKVTGTPQRPRLSVYRSQKHIIAQLIDDTQGLTLSAVSTLSKDLKESKQKPLDAAKVVGKMLATQALAKKIDKAVFDKSGYKYHGRVKAVAEGAREGGLKF